MDKENGIASIVLSANQTGMTMPPDFSTNYKYSIKPKPEMALAKFDGINARCGNCNHKLGEFLKADGEIQCPKSSCKAKNKVKI